MDSVLLMILSNVLDFFFLGQLFKISFVVTCPFANWQLCDFHLVILQEIVHSSYSIVVDFACSWFNSTSVSFVPWRQFLIWLSYHHSFDVFNNVSRVMLRNECRPSCSDSFSAVHKRHWNDWQVMLGLYGLAFFLKKI